MDESIHLSYGQDGQAGIVFNPLRCFFGTPEEKDALSKSARRADPRNHHRHYCFRRLYLRYFLRSNL
jgi:hypothetical protein